MVYGIYGTYLTHVCIRAGYAGSEQCYLNEAMGGDTSIATPWLLGIWLLASGGSLVAFVFRVRQWDEAEIER